MYDFEGGKGADLYIIDDKGQLAKSVSKEIDLIPFVVDTLKKIEPLMIDPVIEHQLALDKDFVSLKQREGFWKRLRGTRGLNVDTTLYK